MIHLNDAEKEKVLDYLRSGEEIAVAPGYAVDHLSGEYTKIDLIAYSDGTDTWSSEDIFNFERNNEDFNFSLIQRILKN